MGSSLLDASLIIGCSREQKRLMRLFKTSFDSPYLVQTPSELSSSHVIAVFTSIDKYLERLTTSEFQNAYPGICHSTTTYADALLVPHHKRKRHKFKIEDNPRHWTAAEDKHQPSKDSPSTATNIRPALRKSGPDVSVLPPKIPNSALQISDSSPKLSDSTRKTSDLVPKMSDSARNMSDSARNMSDSAPKMSDSAPKLSDSAPKLSDSAPKISDSPHMADSVRRLLRQFVRSRITLGANSVIRSIESHRAAAVIAQCNRKSFGISCHLAVMCGLRSIPFVLIGDRYLSCCAVSFTSDAQDVVKTIQKFSSSVELPIFFPKDESLGCIELPRLLPANVKVRETTPLYGVYKQAKKREPVIHMTEEGRNEKTLPSNLKRQERRQLRRRGRRETRDRRKERGEKERGGNPKSERKS